MVGHKQLLAIFCEIKALDFDDIDAHISALDGKTLRMLVIALDEI